ncbi:MAG: PP2C family protein-serine/threonine phosphatase, partial [Aeoliella sp.]
LNATGDATFAVECASVSDLGMRRANNQDAIATVMANHGQWRERGHFFMVADGMGAHAAGELASKLAVDNVPHTYLKLPSVAAPAALRQAVHKANALIHEKGQSAGEFNGMGTTCSCLVLLPGAALIAHVGDSRVYRLRQQRFEQLTFDHSLVWEMAAASQTSADEVPACIPKNVITRSLGPNPTVNVDLEGPYDVRLGDKFLVCSDGLTGVVNDELIGSLVDSLPPQDAANTLVDVANLRGGPDNISIVIAAIRGDSLGSVQCNGEAGKGELEDASCHDMPTSLWERMFGWMWGSNGKEWCQSELGGPYGNGPYRDSACKPATAASDIGFLCRELTSLEKAPESPIAKHASVDWRAFRDSCAEAATSLEANQHQTAVITYAKAIRHLMSQVRSGREDDDSSASRVI